MFGAHLFAELPEFQIIEIFEIASRHTHRADTQAGLKRVDAVEIDQPLQRRAKRRGVIVALRLRRAFRPKRGRREARPKKAGNAKGRDVRGAGFVEQ